ncbi:UdgX family uracil-DNA binding protein [Pseudoroseicyclus aestuarii]|uniref:Type-4 uracil-DNA glycosylase n=1 Tax=Pseudoroseicyclus aestuarii TaxID=1795041 RepID=A0A318SSB2_9RHOB|nr:UdgX family uracil-DNA binding protein [Pseudoroseicyclus aestuarii]PYE84831.1 DNA polymerase [Pseudoroseicyclus aestuarii]
MPHVSLPKIGTDTAWRDAARGLIAAQEPPERVSWSRGEEAMPGLFDGAPAEAPAAASPLTVPRDFVALANKVVWHSDPERFARLYTFLWRLKDNKGLIEDRGDPALAKLREMEKAIRRDVHKTHAFVRFREVPTNGPRRRFGAWFEPEHYSLEASAPFFARRFADMDWMIATPDLTASFEDGSLSLSDGLPRPDLPEDAAEELWGTYFRNIFNPARLKVSAMTSEMPKKYWANLPEAKHIPEMIAGAPARARAMQEAAPTLPPLRSQKILDRLHGKGGDTAMDWDALRQKAEEESRDGREGYGRLVLGEGPHDARLMVVGEQPGDVEDQQGRPFVGPAGQMFDRIAAEAGLDRSAAYVTNAVKRFKFVQRGKRRLHQTPSTGDIEHARWWLDQEIRLLRPAMILSMGGTAAETLTGKRAGILKRRGHVEEGRDGVPVFLTVHPSYLLRLPDAKAQEEGTEAFRADLAAARAYLDSLAA